MNAPNEHLLTHFVPLSLVPLLISLVGCDRAPDHSPQPAEARIETTEPMSSRKPDGVDTGGSASSEAVRVRTVSSTRGFDGAPVRLDRSGSAAPLGSAPSIKLPKPVRGPLAGRPTRSIQISPNPLPPPDDDTIATGSCGGIVNATHQSDETAWISDGRRPWPDTSGAVGPNHLVVVHEEGVQIFDKAGQLLSSQTNEDFWLPLTNVGNLDQSRMIFDTVSQRFFAMVHADRGILPEHDAKVYFAVSHSSDPAGGWSKWRVDVDAQNRLYPTRSGIATNGRWLVLTYDLRPTDNIFTHVGSRILVLDKGTVLAKSPVAVLNRQLPASDSREIAPCQTWDSSQADMFLVDTVFYDTSSGRQLLELLKLSGPTQAPSLEFVDFEQAIDDYEYLPPPGQQPGATYDFDADIARVINAVHRDGKIHLTHLGGLPANGSPDRTAVFWNTVNPLLSSNRILDSGIIEEGPGTHVFAPSIAANCAGDLFLGFSRSSLTRNIEAAYTSRRFDDPAGATRPITTLRAGLDTYERAVHPDIPDWILLGRTSATVVDPVDDTTFWTVQEYAENDVGPTSEDDRWGLSWAHVFDETSSRLHVNASAAPGGNGLTWGTAFRELRDALAIATIPGSGVQEIWVATGSYWPAPPNSSRSSSFGLLDGVSIYGGFLGYETERDQRDPATHVTVLSGDLNGNDSGFFGVADNSYHVVNADGVGPTALLDGFTIRNGAATGSGVDSVGGGLVSYGGSPTLVDCQFFRNQAENRGGGAFLQGGSPTFVRCLFDRNRVNTTNPGAGTGAGLEHTGSPGNHAQIVHCQFRDNDGTVAGGGLNLGASATLIGCLFEGNDADYGGAIASAISADDAPLLIGCTIAYNTAHVKAGGLYGYHSNASYGVLGTRIHSSIFWGNTGGLVEESQILTLCGGSCPSNDIRYTCIQSWPYGGTGNITSNPQFLSSSDLRLQATSPCIDRGLDSLWPNDAWDLDRDGNTSEAWPVDLAGEPRFDDGDGNGSARSDQGAYEVTNTASEPVAPGQTVRLNPGGGSSDPSVESFADFTNLSTYQTVQATAVKYGQDVHPGAPGYLVQGPRGLGLSTTASDGGYFLRISVAFDPSTYGASPDPAEMDLIFFDTTQGTWRLAADGNLGNSPGHAGPRGDRFEVIGGPLPTLSTDLGDHGVYVNTSLQIGFVWANVDHVADFTIGLRDCNGDGTADALQADSDGDRVIDACDQCPQDAAKIEPGDCGCGTPETDTDGDGTPDCLDDCPNDANKTAPGDCGCGSLEIDSDADGVADCIDNCMSTPNPGQEDCDGDGIGDACEGGLDCNANGVPDDCELAGNDCNQNGIPDDCELAGNDCNGNGVLDECELAGNDCNANGVLDTCELSGNDCNANGLLDDCELAGNDCNGNGVLDTCEIAGNDCNGNGLLDDCESGPDCNANGVPDECELANNDCNLNGIPDECETDCNANGVPDECETFTDCNLNGIPDECETDCNANGVPDDCETLADCNGNGVPDECESHPDCNANGLPDVCDILEGRSQDTDGDGIPDECERVLYVDSGAPSGGDGSTWTTAFDDLQAALAIAIPGDNVWIAAGTYRPGPPGSPRTTFFVLPDGVALYGGFAGGETNLDEREVEANVTVLSADLLGDDAQGFANRADNAYHVLLSENNYVGVRLDGLTIRGGQAEGSFPDNHGAALYHEGGLLTLVDCIVTDNWALESGGGIYASQDVVTLIDCHFEGNVAGNRGGGAAISFSTTGLLQGCTFESNSSTSNGAGLWITTDLIVEDCVFESNLSSNDGGGMSNFVGSPVLRRCVFIGNTAAASGGGFSTISGVTLEDCTFDSNTANSGGGSEVSSGPGSSQILRCLFRENTVATTGGGLRASGPAEIRATLFERNEATQGGGVGAGSRELILDGCRFVENVATNNGGGVSHSTSSDPTWFASVNRCIFEGNRAGNRGGGLNLSDTSDGRDPSVTGCLFVGNSATLEGGALAFRVTQGAIRILGCTLVANVSGTRGGGIYSTDNATPVALRNGIAWANVDAFSNGADAQIYRGIQDVTYSCIQDDVAGDGSVFPGTGNLDLDPLFVRPPSDGGDGWGVGDNDDFGCLRLQPVSPCLETADDTAWPADTFDLDEDGDVTELLPFDLVGNPRISDGDGDAMAHGDLGAFEQPVTAADWDFDMGETAILNPGGGSFDPTQDAWIEITNTLGAEDAWVSASDSSVDHHPGTFGFLPVAGTLIVETSLLDGELFMTVRMPFEASALDGADPLSIDLLYFEEIEQTWELAVAGNTQSSPGHPGPVGERFAEEGSTPSPLSGALGDYGVFWNPDLQRGFVWANVDHTTDYAPVGRDCNGNQILDAKDIADGTSFDCDGNGALDQCQVLSIESLSLITGPYAGGQVLRIIGSGFSRDATAVDFDGVPAAQVTWISDTQLEIVTPPFPRPDPQQSGGGNPRAGHLPSTIVDVRVTTCIDSQIVVGAYTFTARR